MNVWFRGNQPAAQRLNRPRHLQRNMLYIGRQRIRNAESLLAHHLLHQRQLILTRGALDRLRNRDAKKPAAAKG